MKTTREIRTASLEDLEKLYEGSAFTILGFLDEIREYDSLENFLFDECGLVKPDKLIIYRASGKLVNSTFGLKGSNMFPDDLNIVLLPLENFGNQIGKLSIIKFQMGARWFDDIIENSR